MGTPFDKYTPLRRLLALPYDQNVEPDTLLMELVGDGQKDALQKVVSCLAARAGRSADAEVWFGQAMNGGLNGSSGSAGTIGRLQFLFEEHADSVRPEMEE